VSGTPASKKGFSAGPVRLVSVDLQYDFSREGGAHYRPRPSVTFVKQRVLPALLRAGARAAEILSDYRLPRHGTGHFCVPGSWGYTSELPENAKVSPPWVKCAASPVWVRTGGGLANHTPGPPYADPSAFEAWLARCVGRPDAGSVVLVGLTLDRCVLATAQELDARGFCVAVMEEGVDTYSGDAAEKEAVLTGPVVKNWAQTVRWADVEGCLRSGGV